ncbi:HD domain-containing phosphohydrolase [Actinoplanes regularis]|uniref:Response regulator c-di-GMP phosphodiesterase, RpfG family, contains REC and HD-GYP domains n=1 Tax=Actinoplanes regularis TaxID=52697 RepID=A0A238ZS80_9ACTN|nr:HD domain-containing phosphohydrolase [Actinoplanes regularis]GIE90297.1 response regulator receiver modulated metal-depenent phosphohydrolase [Actinoplanes regularis]SNR86296.1 Response regulator c-di-GMP phosphodiesterase, RpfG family, contains REC and HD-GYP domains [Actinoplanes regularis]
MTDVVDRPRILLVDDEPNVLDGLRRQLRREFTVETAVGAAKGLFALKPEEPFEVIVSDFLMPGINGAQFLKAAAKAAPHSTRVLLTGHTSLSDAAVTVNEGGVFRMLLKPVETNTMIATLHACVTQHRLLVAESDLLERTLRGSIKALTDVLALANPDAFGRATRMRRVAAAILDRLEVTDRWAVELAIDMSQLGVVSLPPIVAAKLEDGVELGHGEQEMVDRLPQVAVDLISPIPRMAPVADAIRYSRKGFDGSGPPDDGVAGERIPLGGRLLRLVSDHDTLLAQGMSPTAAFATIRSHAGHYDPALLDVFAQTTASAAAASVREIKLIDLKPGMVFAAAVLNKAGQVLVQPDQEVTTSLYARLENFAALQHSVAEPLFVLEEADDGTTAENPVVAGD